MQQHADPPLALGALEGRQEHAEQRASALRTAVVAPRLEGRVHAEPRLLRREHQAVRLEPVDGLRGVVDVEPQDLGIGLAMAHLHRVVVELLRRVDDALALLQPRAARRHHPAGEVQRAADAVRALDHQHLRAARRRLVRERHAGRSGADHDDVELLARIDRIAPRLRRLRRERRIRRELRPRTARRKPSEPGRRDAGDQLTPIDHPEPPPVHAGK